MQMAAKRLRTPAAELPVQPAAQRRRTMPSLAGAIEKVMMIKSLENLEPMFEQIFRKVVREEMERGLAQLFNNFKRSPSFKQIEAVDSPVMKLAFAMELALPIFTGSKIEDVGGNPLRLVLVDTSTGQAHPVPTTLRIEIVVVDGDFASNGRETWTKEEFDRSVLKEREGRRPLLNGDVVATMRDGSTTVLGELSITDNSSWVRSRHFRIGAKVTTEGFRIREAITERFQVKDHRGESYKKNHPPALNDEVWRLEKIAKDGKFHERLTREGINTVQEFLKLYNVDSSRLRSILGQGMSEKMLEATVNHAKNCVLGDRLYVYRGANGTDVVLNPVCAPVGFCVDGFMQPPRANSIQQKALVQEAYLHWNDVELCGHSSSANALPQGMEMSSEYVTPYSNYEAVFEFSTMGGTLQDNLEGSYFGWAAKPEYQVATAVPHNVMYMSEFSSSDDDEGSTLSHGFLPLE